MKSTNLLLHSTWFRIITGLAGCIFGLLLIKTFVTKPLLTHFISSAKWADGTQNLLSGVILLLIYWSVYRSLERREINELSSQFFTFDFVVGLALGSSLISLIVFFLYLLGFYNIAGFHNPANLLLPLSILISAALFEELIFRGIIYRIMEERFGTNIALFQAPVFGILHYANDNATITAVIFVTLLGIVLSLLYSYTNRLWLPFFFHLGWNFAQIIYGTPLSGNTEYETLFNGHFTGPTFFIGTSFGIEDSFFSILLMTMLGVFLYWRCWRLGNLRYMSSYQKDRQSLP